MKIIYRILSILIIPSILILYSYSSGSPGGKTGSTGDGGTTCTQCHTGTAITQGGWITSGIPSEGYTAGETYTITVTGTHTGVVKMGFEVTSENSPGTKKGTWIITNAGRTQLVNLNKAASHTSAGNTPNGDSNTWDVDWTAPAAGTGAIKFNSAVNAANGNGSTSGDQIYTTLLTVQEYLELEPEIVSVDPDSEVQGWSGNIEIEGSETLWLDGVENVVFKYHENTSITLVPVSFTVNSNTMLTAAFNIPSNQQPGAYDVWVDDIMLEEGFEVEEEALNPQITSVDPNAGAQGWTGDVVISGIETTWNDGVGVVVFKYHDNHDIMLTADSFLVGSDTELTAIFSIPGEQQLGLYDVYVDDIMMENGFTVDILDNITEDMEASIKIYPVPAHNIINLELPENSTYRIVSMEGHQMTEFVNANDFVSIDISGFENGIYFLQIVNNGISISNKFIKN